MSNKAAAQSRRPQIVEETTKDDDEDDDDELEVVVEKLTAAVFSTTGERTNAKCAAFSSHSWTSSTFVSTASATPKLASPRFKNRHSRFPSLLT